MYLSSRSLLTTFVIVLGLSKSVSAQSAAPVDLQCEHLVSPLGVDNPHPRFTWRMADNRMGAGQTAYELCVGTDSLAVAKGKSDVWTSGKVKSSTNLAMYEGNTFQPFTKYYWSVTLWDESGKKLPSTAVSSFETGMLHIYNWKGTWISDELSKETKPAPYFRKTFHLHKAIKSARAYIAVGGLYDLYINGKRIGDHVLDPMYTRFDRRNLYVTYDVTSALTNGNNAIGVLLGNGWYNHQSTAVWYFNLAPWRNRPTFCLDLRIIYEDGTTETISSDNSWKTSTGPLIFNSIYTGEHYDARLEQPGWNTINFDDSKWKNAFNRSAPSQHIVSQLLRPIRYVEKIPAKAMTRLNDTTYLFNLGRNIAGISQLTVNGAAGTVIRLKHGERLKKDGHVDQSNIDLHYRPTDNQDPFQTDIYILNGKGEEQFMPHFNYKGFQYVEVSSNKPIHLTIASLTGYFMHSDVPPVGHIETSNQVVNKIWWATNNSYLSNLFGYPTDCPQREKNGWTGDANIACETGLYNFDGITVYEKWMADHRDEQQPNGVLPSIIPSDGWGYEWGNGPDWTSSVAIIPWNLYLFYGDQQPLADNYENIKRYVDHINDLYPTGLTTWGLGDWVPVKSVSPVELTSTVYYYTDANILAKAAQVLGKPEDAAYYSKLADKIKTAFNAKYLNASKGVYADGFQTEMSVPLYWGIVPDSVKSRIAANLNKAVADNNYHLDVGLLGTKAILGALSENGYAETAYRLASQQTYPSWGWWIVNGATTLYENWKIDAKSDISLNHIMFGEIGAWFYKGLAGIKPDPTQPGFKNVILEPNFVAGLDHFTGDFNGPYGKITSGWVKSGNTIKYSIHIPANSTATLGLHLSANQKIMYKGKPLNAYPNIFNIMKNNADDKPQYRIKAGSYSLDIIGR